MLPEMGWFTESSFIKGMGFFLISLVVEGIVGEVVESPVI